MLNWLLLLIVPSIGGMSCGGGDRHLQGESRKAPKEEVFLSLTDGGAGDPEVLKRSTLVQVSDRSTINDSDYTTSVSSDVDYRAWVHKEPAKAHPSEIILIENVRTKKIYSVQTPALEAAPLDEAKWVPGIRLLFFFVQPANRRFSAASERRHACGVPLPEMPS